MATPTPQAPAAGSAGYSLELGERYVSVSGSDLGGVFTLNLWIKPHERFASPASVFSVLGKMRVTLQHEENTTSDGARIRLGMSGTSAWDFDWTAPVPAVPLDKWTQLSFVRSEGEVKVVHNGVVVSATPYTSAEGNGSGLSNEETLFIGKDVNGVYNSFKGEVDEFSAYASDIFFGGNVPTTSRSNPVFDSDPNLRSYIKFDEGRGTALHDYVPSASLSYLSTPGISQSNTYADPWRVSTCPVDDFVSTPEDLPVLVELNGTDATDYPLFAVLTSLPTYGTLHLAIGEGLSEVPDYDVSPILTLNTTVELGRSLVYVPPANNAVLDSFEYAVVAYATSPSSPTAYSASSARVLIDVVSTNDPTYFAFGPTNKLRVGFNSYYTVTDVDSLEENWDSAALATSISLTSTSSSSTFSVDGGKEALVWGVGHAKGGSEVESTEFTSSLANLNSALDVLTLTTDVRNLPSVTTMIMETVDQGLTSDSTQAKSSTNNVTFEYRLGSPPVISEISPTSSQTTGGGKLTLKVSNVSPVSSLKCNFPSGQSDATTVASGTVTCDVLSGSSGFFSVYLTDTMGWESNRVQFRYFETTKLVSVNPNEGTILGGTKVTLKGTSFQSNPVCIFSSGVSTTPLVHSAGTFVSSTTVTCITPPLPPSSSASSTMKLSVTFNGIQGSNQIDYKYTSPVGIVALNPEYGTEDGGFREVTVTGQGFKDTSELICRVGAALCEATFISVNEVKCSVPPLPEDSVSSSALVQVSNNNGADFSSSSVYYKYYPAVSLTGVVPSNGVVTGGTAITVYGTNFVSDGNILAKFISEGGSEAIAPCVYVAATTATCSTPGLPEGLSSIYLSVTSGDTFTGSHVTFLYHEVVTLSLTSTNFLPSSGSTMVTVFGSNFFRSSSLKCEFSGPSSLSTLAVFVSPTVIKCLAPATSPGNYLLSV